MLARPWMGLSVTRAESSAWSGLLLEPWDVVRLAPAASVPGGGYAQAGCWAWHLQRRWARPCEQRRLTVLTGLRFC